MTTARTQRARRIRPRHAVTVAMAVAIVGLTAGPLVAVVDGPQPAVAEQAAPLAPTPPAAPRAATWPAAVWDTDAARSRPLAAARSLASPTDTPGVAHVAVSGGPAGRRLAGVGTTLTTDDLAAIAGLGATNEDLALRGLTAVDGAALGLVAVPEAERAEDLAGTPWEQAASRLLADRAELTVAWGAERLESWTGTPSVAEVVTDELVPHLASHAGAVAPDLLTSADAVGLFTVKGQGLVPTKRGLVWSVAAHAVVPGSRAVPIETRGTGALAVKAYARPDGGGALLVWNPGRARRLVVDVPDGERWARYRVELAGRALSAVVLPAA